MRRRSPRRALLHNLRGTALEARGRLEEADAAYRQAIAADGPDRWTAEFNLARLLYNRGQRAEALDRFDEFITLYNQTEALTAEQLIAIGNAVWYIGNTEPPLFRTRSRHSTRRRKRIRRTSRRTSDR